MKYSLYIAGAAAIAAVATLAPIASAIVKDCPNTFSVPYVDRICDVASFGKAESTVVVNSRPQGAIRWSYVTNLVTGQGLNPRAATVLLSVSGGRSVSTAGTQCPEAVDATLNGADGFVQFCTVSNARPVVSGRLIFVHT
jgi:hypothetical protein